MRKTLSVAMIALNEEANLTRTLASVRWADEIILVDSGSTDATVRIARDFNARVFVEPWRGFAAQKNSAIAHATGDWVLSLDADEEVSPELARQIRHLLDGEPPLNAYQLPRRNHFLGKPLRHGGYWPDLKLRLFRRGAAQFELRPVHETMKTAGAAGRLSAPLLHHCNASLEEYIEHMNRYSSAGAQILVQSGCTSRSLPTFLWNALLNPAATFVYNYFFRLGFLDGREGLLLHLNHSAYVHWKFIKAWWLGQGKKPLRR